MMNQPLRTPRQSNSKNIGVAKGPPNRTLTKADLANAVYSNCVGLSRHRAKAFVDQVLEEIVSALASGESVTLHNFGRFSVREKQERPARNPRTGAPAVVSARRSVAFRGSDYLNEKVLGK